MIQTGTQTNKPVSDLCFHSENANLSLLLIIPRSDPYSVKVLFGRIDGGKNMDINCRTMSVVN